MKVYQRKMEMMFICVGLILSVVPQVWSMTLTTTTTEITTTSRDPVHYPRHLNIFNRTNILLWPSYIRSTDYTPLRSELVTTIRWEFVNNNGVWGVMFDSFSIPYSSDCSSDSFKIWDPSGRCDDLKIVFCGESIPEKFVSCSSKIVVEYHSESPVMTPNFTFRVDHGSTKSLLQEILKREFIPPSDFDGEKRPMVDENEKVVVISLSVILPVALAILGMLAFILAKHTQQDKTNSQEDILPTKCPSSKKYVHSGNDKDSTVVKLFVDNDQKPIRTTKIRLQDTRSERVPLNSYADMPTQLQVFTSVALNDVEEEEPEFEERPNGYLGLM